MKFVWDERKRNANLTKHGLDFEAVVHFGWSRAVIEPGNQPAASKPRFKAIGFFEGELAIVIFALLGTEAISIISFRTASSIERRKFHAQA